jgi:hypothetical protein
MTDPKPTTADGLRAAIDRGLAGDKVPGSDPAAAPLGTDAEAGGAPPTPAEIAMEADSTTMRAPPERASPEQARAPRPAWLWAGGLVVVLLIAIAIAGAG